MNIKCAYTDLVKIEDLKRHPENDKIHPDNKDLNERLARVIKYQGWRFPIVASKQTGYIIAGHARLESAKILGIKEVPVDYQDFDNYDQEISQLVADNALQEWREINLSAINEIVIPELDGANFDFEMLAIKDFTLDVSEKEKTKKIKKCPECGFEF